MHVTNQDFIDGGGSPYDGQARPLCDAKLVPGARREVDRARTSSSSPTCRSPAKFWGLVNDNLNVSIDPKATLFGEIAGIGNAPVGLYDFTDRLVDTAHTDPNGFFTALVPSTSTYNCPLPAGPCPSVYRVVGNDPGQPSARNLDYHPEFDTISANFQAWPGLMLPVDTANTAVGTQVQSPGSNVTKPVQCLIAGTTPQLFAVSAPYGNAGDQIVVKGLHFGATAGRVHDRRHDDAPGGSISGWSDTSFTLTIPASVCTGPAPPGDRQHGLRRPTRRRSTASRCTCSARATGRR